MAKARVAPSQIKTIPRLELSAALLSSEVSSKLNQELDDPVLNFFYTDSKIVLSYLANEARKIHVFVANRITKIKNFSSSDQWHYVPTNKNPADYASKGMYPTELMKSVWFTGPEFLWKSESILLIQ